MHHETHEKDEAPRGTLFSYTLGFALSILLTLFAFWVAPQIDGLAFPLIIFAALIQLVVQLVFFLHLGRGGSRGWNLTVFSFTVVIIGILVIGTLWIMQNLQHLHAMPPTTTDLYENGLVAPQNELK